MCRQLTIRSMFFITALVAVLLVCTRNPPDGILLFFDGPLAGNLLWLSLFMHFVVPLWLTLLVKRISIIVVASFVICLCDACIISHLEFVDSSAFFSGFWHWCGGVAYGFFLPMLSIRDRIEFALQTNAMWTIIPYGLFYITVAPAFAWTCCREGR